MTAALFLGGCGGIDINRYAGLKPQFDLYSYFEGTTRGWGMVLNRQGAMTRQFTVDIVGSVNDEGNMILDEQFLWNDGKRERRVWTIRRAADDRYSGTASDVVGEADGVSSGNALLWKYTLSLDLDGSTWDIGFSDWMFLQPDGVLLNRAQMSKFGIRVGEVIISFKKQGPT
jgi:hypothetical protein